MEQMSGLAWLTGHADDQPRIQRGPCDPLAGMHASFAFLVALAEREASGRAAAEWAAPTRTRGDAWLRGEASGQAGRDSCALCLLRGAAWPRGGLAAT